MNEELKVALVAAWEAGEAIMGVYNSEDFDVEIKSDNSPLTRADRLAHDVILSHLRPTGIPVLSEEGKHMPFEERKSWDRLWIVDPVDGTKEFIKRNGEFTVNIALVECGNPILGVVLAPALGLAYVGNLNDGAWLLDVELGMEQAWQNKKSLPLPSTDRPYTVVASRSHMSEETEAFIQSLEQLHGKVATLSKGSSLKLCMVAEGSADAYPRFAPTMEWDTAAGQAVCMAAGLDVIDQQSQTTMVYNRENLLNAWFLVCDPHTMKIAQP